MFILIPIVHINTNISLTKENLKSEPKQIKKRFK